MHYSRDPAQTSISLRVISRDSKEKHRAKNAKEPGLFVTKACGFPSAISRLVNRRQASALSSGEIPAATLTYCVPRTQSTGQMSQFTDQSEKSSRNPRLYNDQKIFKKYLLIYLFS